MSYQDDSIDWQAITNIDLWLDRDVATPYKTQPLAQDWARVGKIGEELGEAIQALVGYTGQNPRKGVVNTRDDMLTELADVIATGILAIQHFTKDATETRDIIRAKIAAIEKRVPHPFTTIPRLRRIGERE